MSPLEYTGVDDEWEVVTLEDVMAKRRELLACLEHCDGAGHPRSSPLQGAFRHALTVQFGAWMEELSFLSCQCQCQCQCHCDATTTTKTTTKTSTATATTRNTLHEYYVSQKLHRMLLMVETWLRHHSSTSDPQWLTSLVDALQTKIDTDSDTDSDTDTIDDKPTRNNECLTRALALARAQPPVTISNWMSPTLLLNVALASPVICESSLTSSSSSSVPPASGLDATAKTPPFVSSLPYRVEVRCHTVLPLPLPWAPTPLLQGAQGGSDSPLPAVAVEIHRCRHVDQQMTLLLSLTPLDDIHSNHRLVRKARCIQTNAPPPKLYSSMDLFTSSCHGDNRITMALRCPTKTPIHGGDIPHILVELIL